MSVQNTRQKGRAFVLKILEILRRDIDEAAYEVSGSGSGKDKGDIRVPRFDLVIEAKDSKTCQVASWIDQTDRQGLGYSKTALFWKRPKSPSAHPDIRVDIPLDYFIELLQRFGEPIIKKEDREFKWKIQRLIQSSKDVLKELE